MNRKRQSRSDFVREEPLRETEEQQWREVLQYGERRARAQGIGPADVAPLVDEYRADKGTVQTQRPVREAGTLDKGQSK